MDCNFAILEIGYLHRIDFMVCNFGKRSNYIYYRGIKNCAFFNTIEK
jgi:hypothetical protein